MRIVFTFCLFFFFINTQAQNQLILNKITDYQIKNDDIFYNKGLFPSQRLVMNKKKTVEDNNIFLTALTLYTLKSLQDSLTASEKLLINNIINNSSDVFKYYANRNGGITYNFYQVYPNENPFPNARFMKNSKRTRLPDDLDDTSIIYLVKNSSDSLNYQLKNKMVEHSGKEIYTSTYKQFREMEVYKTWFAEKMKQDIDICVLTNVLLFVFEKKLRLSATDSVSMRVIKHVIQNNLHLNKAYLISSHYQNTAIILYHIARLISTANFPVLNELKPKIIQDINNALKNTSNAMENVILLTSLIRLGENTNFSMNFQDLENDMKKFYWFVANPFCGSKFWLRRILGKSNIKYKNEAYYMALILELSVLSNANFVKENNQLIFKN